MTHLIIENVYGYAGYCHTTRVFFRGMTTDTRDDYLWDKLVEG
jgi:hypothetical protein